MSYEEFMKELGGLLAGVPEEEKEEALQYYSDYFADAGRENENQVLSELGSPRKVAELIKAGLRNGGMDGGEFTEYGYTDERFAKKDDLMRREPKKEKKSQNRYSYQGQEKSSYSGSAYRKPEGSDYSYGNGSKAYESGAGAYNNGKDTYGNAYGNGNQGNTSYQQKGGPWTNRGLKILLVVLIVFCALPVAFPAVIAVAAVIFGIAVAAISIFFALVIGAAAVVIAGIVIICAGLSKLILLPSAALLTTGIGLLIFVIGLVAAVAAVRLCMLVYPALFRFLVGICRKPFHRKAGV